jgi:hypothetical protein
MLSNPGRMASRNGRLTVLNFVGLIEAIAKYDGRPYERRGSDDAYCDSKTDSQGSFEDMVEVLFNVDEEALRAVFGCEGGAEWGEGDTLAEPEEGVGRRSGRSIEPSNGIPMP